MDLGQLWCRPRRQRHCANRSCSSSTRLYKKIAACCSPMSLNRYLPESGRYNTSARTRSARRVFYSIFQDVCLLGNGERFSRADRERTYHQLLHKVCLSSPLPIRDLYPSICSQITVMFTAFRALILFTTPPLPSAPQNTPSASLSRFPSAAPVSSSSYSAIILRARDGGQSHPHTIYHTHWW